MSLQVIGAGLGRTGTMSLKFALEELGMGPCFHMTELLERPERLKYLKQYRKTGNTDWSAFFESFSSAVDYPVCLYYKHLMELYPEAKVILTVRDSDSWYESVKATIWNTSPKGPGDIFRLIINSMRHKALRRVAPVFKNSDDMIWKEQFHGKFADKEYAKGVYEAHNEEVKATVPADRLLVFEAKQGWEPLCNFLGKEVPAKDFPRSNDTAEFNRKVDRLMNEGVFQAYA
ncbi:MAG TPA: sulfotransferase family protein [Cytophagales bacterium]|nr:sulfotransferase family protein [Cytophagales bacterium]HAA24055.1 sulfotransferase family protein [Cytophagales bacterium]HAP64706.1 sulfotransferase family protein [Cytophagales bacterium]